ncbi:protein of unknown function [Cupriavidus taiwanensis]|uniref:Uncharacterized protein n=1 Tax=Cupriavidus taiwanensis TaxID=164546 RepID=A0A375IDR1_9BURK|nr:protein of unknown function [Cupriavidus taiwanensis]
MNLISDIKFDQLRIDRFDIFSAPGRVTAAAPSADPFYAIRRQTEVLAMPAESQQK